MKFKCWHTCAPRSVVCLADWSLWWLIPVAQLTDPVTAKCPEPLRPISALPLWERRLAPSRKALPFLHRSYGLMRQTFTLLPISGFALIRKVFAGCCQPLLRKGPSQRCRCRPSLRAGTHTPAAPKVPSPVSTPGTLAFPVSTPGRRLASFHLCYFGWMNTMELQSFLYVPARKFARLTDSSYPYTCVSGSRGFYGRAYHGWLPAPCSGYANHPIPGN
jgi:hypothetical protein